VAKVTGGRKFAAALTMISARLSSPGTLRVGFLEGATYPNGTSVPMVAAIQEFGAPRAGIPPRPYFRPMIAAKSPAWPAAIAENLRGSGYDVDAALGLVGEGVKGQLQESIINTNSPALSPVTVMLRGMKSQDQSLVVTRRVVAQARARVAAGLTNYGASTKPLVESGHLVNSVDYEIKK
jgi:hypothetical protein